ncbi:hypothetical protein OGATHE_005942 [Ogataea polymorpha]|uniref:Uncharacterized protein n=1 Tax=Ogataea polymorpha TaxID=460523 RepID=A0A9P8NUJ2_9ASCO|nr:hypothetical protein OGATHE_005942 [Ogataea polymorpha]
MPTARRVHPMNSTRRACHLIEPLPKLSDAINCFLSIMFTVMVPKVLQMKGIQSTKVTWTTEALTVLEKMEASTIAQKPMAYNAPEI